MNNIYIGDRVAYVWGKADTPLTQLVGTVTAISVGFKNPNETLLLVKWNNNRLWWVLSSNLRKL